MGAKHWIIDSLRWGERFCDTYSRKTWSFLGLAIIRTRPTEGVIEYQVSLTHRRPQQIAFSSSRETLCLLPRGRYFATVSLEQDVGLLRKSWLTVSPDTILAQRGSIVLPDRCFAVN